MSTPEPADFAALSDDELLAQIRRVAETADPAPQLVQESAAAVFALRSLGPGLLVLLSDSLIDEQPQPVRGQALVPVPDSGRDLTFTAPDGSVEVALSVHAVAGRRHLLGQLVETAATPGERLLRVRSEMGDREVSVSASGLFNARDLPAGPVRLEFVTPRRQFTASITL